ncbi:unnamed protein product [Parnassius apollo]|uniref:(apollo) hypothetical protein n=1 Tax=Parnassius apollo TaxID=110799 RepID=A0A8S3XFH6_PARAO|nr:unnamed protein product [Parnassius apollo]
MASSRLTIVNKCVERSQLPRRQVRRSGAGAARERRSAAQRRHAAASKSRAHHAPSTSELMLMVPHRVNWSSLQNKMRPPLYLIASPRTGPMYFILKIQHTEIESLPFTEGLFSSNFQCRAPVNPQTGRATEIRIQKLARERT